MDNTSDVEPMSAVLDMLSTIPVSIPDIISGIKCNPSEMKQRILACFLLAAFSAGDN